MRGVTPWFHESGLCADVGLFIYSPLMAGEEAEVFEKIKKRDGRVVEFDSPKITAAIAKAGNATGEFQDREAKKLTL